MHVPGAALALLAAVLAVAPPAAAGSNDPGARPDASLDGRIHTLQLDLVARTAQQAVAAAGVAVAGDRLLLQQQVATLNTDDAAANAAAARLARDRAATAGATSLHAAAIARRRHDAADLRLADRRLSALALTLYLGTGSPDPVTLQEAQLGVEQTDELETVTSAIEVDRSEAVAAWRRAVRSTAVADRTLAGDRAAVRAARAGRAGADRARAGARAAVADARDTLTAALSQLTSATAARDAAAAAFDGPEGQTPDPVPTILGRSALDAAQLAGWFRSAGYVAQTRASIQRLAAWYVEEGKAEGVRGDLAFAQAVLETGGFSSPDAILRHNFAGIGHCDSCGAGWAFPDDHLGVRGQIQLLRTYATPGLTAGGLVHPPALPTLDPARQSARGCCATWPALTGVWATDPVYGRSILELYEQMLSWAAGSR